MKLAFIGESLYKVHSLKHRRKFNCLAVPFKAHICIVEEFSAMASMLDKNRALEKTYANQRNTPCFVVLHPKQRKKLVRILAVWCEIPASTVHAVKGFLKLGPCREIGVAYPSGRAV